MNMAKRVQKAKKSKYKGRKPWFLPREHGVRIPITEQHMGAPTYGERIDLKPSHVTYASSGYESRGGWVEGPMGRMIRSIGAGTNNPGLLRSMKVKKAIGFGRDYPVLYGISKSPMARNIMEESVRRGTPLSNVEATELAARMISLKAMHSMPEELKGHMLLDQSIHFGTSGGKHSWISRYNGVDGRPVPLEMHLREMQKRGASPEEIRELGSHLSEMLNSLEKHSPTYIEKFLNTANVKARRNHPWGKKLKLKLDIGERSIVVVKGKDGKSQLKFISPIVTGRGTGAPMWFTQFLRYGITSPNMGYKFRREGSKWTREGGGGSPSQIFKMLRKWEGDMGRGENPLRPKRFRGPVELFKDRFHASYDKSINPIGNLPGEEFRVSHTIDPRTHRVV